MSDEITQVMDAEERNSIRGALSQTAAVSAAPRQRLDVYKREADAILHADQTKEDVVERVLKRMALDLIKESDTEVTFAISHSITHSALVVEFKKGYFHGYTFTPLES